ALARLDGRGYVHLPTEEPVEIVNIRLAAIGKRASLALPRLSAKRSVKAHRTTQVHLGDPDRAVSCPVYRREDLGAGARISGPALVREHGTTTVLFRGDLCSVAKTGELLVSVRGAA